MGQNALQQTTDDAAAAGDTTGQVDGGGVPDDAADPADTGDDAGQGADHGATPGGGDGATNDGGAGGSADDQGDDEGDDAAAPKRGANARIREVLAREKAAIQYAEYWRRKAMEGDQQGAPAPEKPKPAPVLDDFGGDTQRWAKAYAEWSDKQIDRKVAEATQRQHQQATEEQAKSSTRAQWQERMTKFAASTPDAYEVIANPTLPISETMSEVIQESENGPALAYHLGRNPGEAARIARLSPAQAAAALGRLEAKLEPPAAGGAPPPAGQGVGGAGGAAAPGKTAPKRSSAPPPPNTITGSGSSKVDNDMDMPIEDFLAKITGRRR